MSIGRGEIHHSPEVLRGAVPYESVTLHVAELISHQFLPSLLCVICLKTREGASVVCRSILQLLLVLLVLAIIVLETIAKVDLLAVHGDVCIRQELFEKFFVDVLLFDCFDAVI